MTVGVGVAAGRGGEGLRVCELMGLDTKAAYIFQGCFAVAQPRLAVKAKQNENIHILFCISDLGCLL